MPTPNLQHESNQSGLFVRMILGAWDTYNSRVTKLLESLPDDVLAGPTATGRNTGHYILGHLVAISDALLPLLGFGDRIYPELDAVFVQSPERADVDRPSITELREYWKKVNDRLTSHILEMTEDAWLTRHTKVSPEDFAREPHRNKLNVIINRTNHTSYHLGQLVYLLPKENKTAAGW
jgi:uncharacterized damage-inducible protein DinB